MTDVLDTKSFYDRISKVYDALSDSSERKARQLGIELLTPKPGERILEIGFGTGHGLVELARRVGPEGRIDGVDISVGMREVATNRIESEGLSDRIGLELAAVPPLPYPDDAFNAVAMSFTLELFADAQISQVLAEVRRVLRPGGRLGLVAMSEPDEGEHDSLMEKAYKWMHRHFPHIVDCRPIDASRHLAAAGFSIQRQETVTIWTMPVVVLTAKPE